MTGFLFCWGNYFNRYKKKQKNVFYIMNKQSYNLFICFYDMLCDYIIIDVFFSGDV